MCGRFLKLDVSPHHVSVTGFNNVSLKCLVEETLDSCSNNESLQWFFNGPLKSGEKYEIQERKTKTKCKTDFIITIFNVTEADEGKYKCTWFCEKDNRTLFNGSSTIELMVFPLPAGSPTGLPTGMNNCVIISSAFLKDVRVGEIFRYKEKGGKKDKF